MANKQEAKSGSAVFSVEKWLETANADKAAGILTNVAPRRLVYRGVT